MSVAPQPTTQAVPSRPANKLSGVTVVIVHWHRTDLLERCLRALAEQTLGVPHVIVVANGPEAAEAVRSRKFALPVECLALPANHGFAAAANEGVRAARGRRWIALLNDDAFPEADWLEQLLQQADRHPRAACFASLLVRDADPEILDGAGDAYHVSGLAWRCGHGRRRSDRPVRNTEVFSACGAAALVRRQAFMEAGGFYEPFGSYFEDVDLGFRLRLAGDEIRLAADARVRHVGSASARPEDPTAPSALFLGHRNLVWTFFRNMPWPLLLALLPLHLAMNVAAVAWFALRGQGGVLLRAKWSALRGLSAVLRSRQAIQRRRTVSSGTIARLLAWRRNE